MEVYLSRNHQTCLHLFPLSVGRFQDVFDQPNGPDGQPPHFVISRFVSSVEALDRNLKDVVIWDLSGLSQLNELVEAVERMSGRDLQIFSGALDLESISSPADALRIVKNLRQYELFPQIKADEDLGRFLVDTSPVTGKFSFPEEVKPYLDYAKIGAEQRNALGGVYTSDGFVKRRENAPMQEEASGIIALTLATAERWYYLSLPSSEEEIERAKRDLDVEDFAQAGITAVKFTTPQLNGLIPLDTITVEDANALALCLQEMREEDGGLMKFCAVLEAEQPNTFAEALNIAMDRDDYELIPEDMDEYGKQVLRRAGADDEIIDTIDGYMDFAQLGTDSLAEDGVRRTEFGLVRRLSKPFPPQEIGQTMM